MYTSEIRGDIIITSRTTAGEEKWIRKQTDSNMATPFAPMLPLGVTPRPPIRPAHRSLQHTESCTFKPSSLTRSFFNMWRVETDLRISPYRLGITRTSNWVGSWTIWRPEHQTNSVSTLKWFNCTTKTFWIILEHILYTFRLCNYSFQTNSMSNWT